MKGLPINYSFTLASLLLFPVQTNPQIIEVNNRRMLAHRICTSAASPSYFTSAKTSFRSTPSINFSNPAPTFNFNFNLQNPPSTQERLLDTSHTKSTKSTPNKTSFTTNKSLKQIQLVRNPSFCHYFVILPRSLVRSGILCHRRAISTILNHLLLSFQTICETDTQTNTAPLERLATRCDCPSSLNEGHCRAINNLKRIQTIGYLICHMMGVFSKDEIGWHLSGA